MVRISVIRVTLLIACVTIPALAQAPPANPITCSSGTACKKGNIPVFASNGGAAKVDDSIIKQSGSTISVAGSETVTTNISAGGNVTATGNVSGGVVNATTSFDIGGGPFAFGNGGNGNAFLGFAGNFSTTGTDDTAAGAGALQANTSGSGQVAYGQAALVNNTTGNDNAAFGTNALFNNTTGSENTAIGVDALEATNGSGLTCVGFDCTAAGHKLHNATAIGAHAMVKVSNALVLGSVAGVNGA